MTEAWTVKKALQWTTGYFESKQIPEPRLGAELLLAHILQCKRLELYLRFDSILTPNERATYREVIYRRVEREPVQHILGYTEFMGYPIKVSREVLVPRPETEQLVDKLVEFCREHRIQDPRIVDIGSGTGCIAIALKHLMPEASITAIEKSGKALELAKQNAAENNVDVQFISGDVFEVFNGEAGSFNLIVTNPPYITQGDYDKLEPEVKNFEPIEALVGGADGLDFYRRLAPLAKKLLSDDGSLFMEVGYDQAEAVAALFAREGFKTNTAKDYNQIDRVVFAHRK
ncbi:MAG: peptide chain release factor N(5)-glutamine methyltransferase [Calditrichia bacterium]